MATELIYINDLDPVVELQPTDNIVVETIDGTKRILFKDFILGQDNVDFYEEVAQNSLDIISLSADYSTLSTSVSVLSTNLISLSASVDESFKYGHCYVTFDSAGTMTKVISSANISSITNTDAGSRVYVQVLNTSGIDFTKSSINVTLDTTLSASSDTTAVQTYAPFISDRSTFSFKIGISNYITGGFTPALSASNLGFNIPIKSNGINISFRYR